jgi:hypothetical protein
MKNNLIRIFSLKETLIFIIFVKHVVFICACPINLENDTAEYCRQALSLLGLLPETDNFNFHPPGYAIILALANFIFGEYTLYSLLIFQHLLCFTTTIYLINICSRSKIIYVFILITSVTTFSCNSILTESIVSSLLLFSVCCFIQVHKGNLSNTSLTLLSVSLSLLIIMKTVFFFMVFPALFLLYKTPSFRTYHYFKFTLIVITLPLISMSINYIRWDKFMLSDRSELHLYNRVVAKDKTVDPNGKFFLTLKAQIKDDKNIFSGHWNSRNILIKKGFSFDETVNLLGNVSIEGIKYNYFNFLTNTVYHFFDDFFIEPSFGYFFDYKLVDNYDYITTLFGKSYIDDYYQYSIDYRQLKPFIILIRLNNIFYNKIILLSLLLYTLYNYIKVNKYFIIYTFPFFFVFFLHTTFEVSTPRYAITLYSILPFILTVLLGELKTLFNYLKSSKTKVSN